MACRCHGGPGAIVPWTPQTWVWDPRRPEGEAARRESQPSPALAAAAEPARIRGQVAGRSARDQKSRPCGEASVSVYAGLPAPGPEPRPPHQCGRANTPKAIACRARGARRNAVPVRELRLSSPMLQQASPDFLVSPRPSDRLQQAARPLAGPRSVSDSGSGHKVQLGRCEAQPFVSLERIAVAAQAKRDCGRESIARSNT